MLNNNNNNNNEVGGGGDDDMINMVTTEDGTAFIVGRRVAEQSETLKNLIEDVGDITQVIQLPNVTGKVYEKVIEFCKHALLLKQEQKQEQKQEEEAEDEKKLTEWEESFVKDMENDFLVSVLLAANFLEVKPLLELMCTALARRMDNKSVQELREMLSLENDFTPEEEEENAKENEWVEEIPMAEIETN